MQFNDVLKTLSKDAPPEVRAMVDLLCNYAPQTLPQITSEEKALLALQTAVQTYTGEFKRLPQEYKKLCSKLVFAGYLSFDDVSSYEDDIHTALGSKVYIVSDDAITERVDGKPFPWQRDPALIEQLPPKLASEVERFTSQVLKFRKCSEAFQVCFRIVAPTFVKD